MQFNQFFKFKTAQKFTSSNRLRIIFLTLSAVLSTAAYANSDTAILNSKNMNGAESTENQLCESDSIITEVVEISKKWHFNDPMTKQMKEKGYELTATKGIATLDGVLENVKNKESVNFLSFLNGKVVISLTNEKDVLKYMRDFKCLNYDVQLKQKNTYIIEATPVNLLFEEMAQLLDQVDRISVSQDNKGWMNPLTLQGYEVKDLHIQNSQNSVSALIGYKSKMTPRRPLISVDGDMIKIDFPVFDLITAQNLEILMKKKGYETRLSLLSYELHIGGTKAIAPSLR